MSRDKHFDLRVRCKGKCGRLLGVVDDEGRLVTESKRTGWYIKQIMEKGTIICTNCGTALYWNAFSIPRATPGHTTG